MKPRKSECEERQSDLFGIVVEEIVDRRQPLVKLSEVISWSVLEEEFSKYYADFGRPGEPIRLLLGLEYLKYSFDLSDEEVIERWRENAYWQYFCGEKYFRYESPIIDGRRKLSRYRKLVQRRRSVVEAKIAHMKHHSRMCRNYLLGKAGDCYNAILCGAAVNLRKLIGEIYLLLYFWLKNGTSSVKTPALASFKAFLGMLAAERFTTEASARSAL